MTKQSISDDNVYRIDKKPWPHRKLYNLKYYYWAKSFNIEEEAILYARELHMEGYKVRIEVEKSYEARFTGSRRLVWRVWTRPKIKRGL